MLTSESSPGIFNGVYIKISLYIFFWSDPPTKFSSDYLGDPSITYLDGTDIAVSLVCEASIFKGIEKWLNVTYRIEWFAEGKSLKSEAICGGLLPGEQHQAPCQSVANAKVHSTLEPSKYKIGQWVSPWNIKFAKERYSDLSLLVRHLLPRRLNEYTASFQSTYSIIKLPLARFQYNIWPVRF